MSYGAVVAALGVGLPVCAHAETLAGTPIVNTAALRYDRDGTSQSIASNTVTLTVAERLDVRLVREGQGAVVVARSSGQPTIVRLTLTNADNGSESFALDASISSPTITLLGLAVDGNGDGRYDPATDTAPVDGRTPVLAPGQSITLFAILLATPNTGPDTGTGTSAGLTVTARSVTGSGKPGAGYDGMGDGGGDAVVGPTGAIANVVVPLTTGLAGPALIKSQSVRAADGSQNAVRDAVITYTLEARFTDAVTGARIADPIPEGTVFVPGSLTLDGAPLSDAADSDAGRLDASGQGAAGIAVALGQVAAASVHTVQFKAKIQ
ncbi:hypothetical protein [Sphingomonas sp. OK281]|uniref:hypothetical protein n=1 Tax=Sphingomonas sp. OK281 TaxID=1881067 RepID=UPI0008F3EB66|nr:hypothetical protein [Sphingomonas sp. OK281]SFN96826.1 conserved repeat domain-containing protein [Sphingomonas sp. OK281]